MICDLWKARIDSKINQWLDEVGEFFARHNSLSAFLIALGLFITTILTICLIYKITTLTR